MAKILIPGGLVELLAAAAVNLQDPTQMRSGLSYNKEDIQALHAIDITPQITMFILSQSDLLNIQLQTVHGKAPEPQSLPPYLQLTLDELKAISPEEVAKLPPLPEGESNDDVTTPVHIYAVLTASHLLVPLLLQKAQDEKDAATPEFPDDGGRGIGVDLSTVTS